MSELKKGFDLAQVLSDVSSLDTNDGRQQIEYVSIDLIVGDPANFYELSEIDALANNIALIGLQQPLRVRQSPNDESQVIIVSGHRRYAAIRKLVEEGRDDLRDIPCIVDTPSGSEALQELRLIYANSDTRRMTSSDLNKQADRIEKLLYQLKEEGYEFPGRMRDHVAEVCKVSKTKLARLKMIRDHLHDFWQPAYQEGRLNESVSYALSKLPTEDQLTIWNAVTSIGTDPRHLYEYIVQKDSERFNAIEKFIASKSVCLGGCANREGKRVKAASLSGYGCFYCDKCCSDCPELAKCKYSCPSLNEKKAQLKADAKAQKQQEKAAEENRLRPRLELIDNIWSRFATARNDASLSIKDVVRAAGSGYYSGYHDHKFEEYEKGLRKITETSDLPFSSSVRVSDVLAMTGVADALGVSLDYLLCRTANPTMNDAPPPLPADSAVQHWHSGSENPKESIDAVVDFEAEGLVLRKLAYWDGRCWRFSRTGSTIDASCVRWLPIPATT